MVLASALIVGAHENAAAQSGAPDRPTTADAVFARARQLVVTGNGAAGRVLIDSVVAALDPETPAYAEALYWRASLAADTDDATRDYRRIIVEYPLSSRASESLLKLGQLEQSRGERAAAARHLGRYLLENPSYPERGQVGLDVVRMFFDVNEAPSACRTLGRVLGGVTETDVEMRNQLTYYSPRCAGVDTMRVDRAPAPDSTPAPVKRAATPTTKKPTAARGRFTLQVAAYSTKADAEQLAAKLDGRGLDARVVGSTKPFRVHVGRYATRAEASAAAKELKSRKIDAFITTSPDDRYDR